MKMTTQVPVFRCVISVNLNLNTLCLKWTKAKFVEPVFCACIHIYVIVLQIQIVYLSMWC